MSPLCASAFLPFVCYEYFDCKLFGMGLSSYVFLQNLAPWGTYTSALRLLRSAVITARLIIFETCVMCVSVPSLKNGSGGTFELS